MNSTLKNIIFKRRPAHPSTSYFSAIRADPARFIYARPELRAWLQHMRARLGVCLFVVTNSHADYTHLLMTTAFGADWPTLFDVTVVFGQKPAFFTKQMPFRGAFPE